TEACLIIMIVSYSFFLHICLYLVLIHFVSFLNVTRPTEIYTLSLHDALPIWAERPARHLVLHRRQSRRSEPVPGTDRSVPGTGRSEEHTSELQSRSDLVCRLLLEKKKNNYLLSITFLNAVNNRVEYYMNIIIR